MPQVDPQPRQGQNVATAEVEFVRRTRDTSNAPPHLQPPNDGATMVHADWASPTPNSIPLQGLTLVTSEDIGESEDTTPETRAVCITEVLTTFHDLLSNQ